MVYREVNLSKRFYDLYDVVKSAFRNHPHFLQQFTVEFVHKDFEEHIDLDSPIQLLETAKKLMMIAVIFQSRFSAYL